MKDVYLPTLFLLALVTWIAAAPEDRGDKPGKGGGGKEGQGAGAGGQVEPAVIPAYAFNTWLGFKPMPRVFTESAIAWRATRR